MMLFKVTKRIIPEYGADTIDWIKFYIHNTLEDMKESMEELGYENHYYQRDRYGVEYTVYAMDYKDLRPRTSSY